jgi:hypothetical protein
MFNIRKLQKIEEDKINVRIAKMNDELLEHLTSTVGYLLHQEEKHGLHIPNKEQIQSSVRKAHSLLSDMSILASSSSHQPKVNTNNTTDKVPEPASRNCIVSGTLID